MQPGTNVRKQTALLVQSQSCCTRPNALLLYSWYLVRIEVDVPGVLLNTQSQRDDIGDHLRFAVLGSPDILSSVKPNLTSFRILSHLRVFAPSSKVLQQAHRRSSQKRHVHCGLQEQGDKGFRLKQHAASMWSYKDVQALLNRGYVCTTSASSSRQQRPDLLGGFQGKVAGKEVGRQQVS